MNLLKLAKVVINLKDKEDEILNLAVKNAKTLISLQERILLLKKEYTTIKKSHSKTKKLHEEIVVNILNQFKDVDYLRNIFVQNKKYKIEDIINKIFSYPIKDDFLSLIEFAIFSDFEFIPRINIYDSVLTDLLKNYEDEEFIFLFNLRFISTLLNVTNTNLYTYFSEKVLEFLVGELEFDIKKHDTYNSKNLYNEYPKYIEAMHCVSSYIKLLYPDIYSKYYEKINTNKELLFDYNGYILTNQILYQARNFDLTLDDLTASSFLHNYCNDNNFYKTGNFKKLHKKLSYIDYTNFNYKEFQEKFNIDVIKKINHGTDLLNIDKSKRNDIGLYGEDKMIIILFLDYLKQHLSNETLHDFPIIIKISDLRNDKKIRLYLFANNLYGCDYIVLDKNRQSLKYIEVKTTISINEIITFKLTDSELACCHDHKDNYFVYWLMPDNDNPYLIRKYELNYEALKKLEVID